MISGEWTLRSRRVVTPSGTLAADLVIRDEKIEALAEHDGHDREGVILDVGDLLVLPGLVALHVDEPREHGQGGFEQATDDAAVGGVTTLIDLPPDDSPDSNSPSGFNTRMNAARGKLRVDCGLVIGLGHGNTDLIEPWVEAGVIGIEAFLDPVGCGGVKTSIESDLRITMATLARLGRPLLFHAERVVAPPPPGETGRFASALSGREFDAIRLLIRLCRESRCHVHLIHPTGSEALPMIAEARAEGLPLTVETCPHHLCFARSEIVDEAPTLNLNPRSPGPDDRERLWDGLTSGLIDSVGADHPRVFGHSSRPAPGLDGHLPHEYTPLPHALAAVWTEARRRGFTTDDVARWMAGRPASILGLSGSKGSIEPHADADLVIFDPDANFLADPDPLRRRRSATPLGGRVLTGRVDATVLRGSMIYQAGRFHDLPKGSVVRRFEETLRLTDMGTKH